MKKIMSLTLTMVLAGAIFANNAFAETNSNKKKDVTQRALCTLIVTPDNGDPVSP